MFGSNVYESRLSKGLWYVIYVFVVFVMGTLYMYADVEIE